MLLLGVASVTTITNDGGGNVMSYAWQWANAKARGDQVVIDGNCFSACTMAIGLAGACATPRAVFGFHSAYTPVLFWHVYNKPATDYMWSTYPQPVKQWIADHGGLEPALKFLQGEEMLRIVKNC